MILLINLKVRETEIDYPRVPFPKCPPKPGLEQVKKPKAENSIQVSPMGGRTQAFKLPSIASQGMDYQESKERSRTRPQHRANTWSYSPSQQFNHFTKCQPLWIFFLSCVQVPPKHLSLAHPSGAWNSMYVWAKFRNWAISKANVAPAWW